MTSVKLTSRAVLVVIFAATALVGCSSGPAQTQPPGSVYLSARDIAFVESSVGGPAGEAFQVYFENLDSVPHNVNVVGSDGVSVAKTDVFNGPSGRILDVPALAAGTYKLYCEVHPEMKAELVAS